MSETTAPTGGSNKTLKITEDLKDKFNFDVLDMEFEVDVQRQTAKLAAEGNPAASGEGTGESGTIIKPGVQGRVSGTTYLGIITNPEFVINRKLEEAEREDNDLEQTENKDENSRDE